MTFEKETLFKNHQKTKDDTKKKDIRKERYVRQREIKRNQYFLKRNNLIRGNKNVFNIKKELESFSKKTFLNMEKKDNGTLMNQNIIKKLNEIMNKKRKENEKDNNFLNKVERDKYFNESTSTKENLLKIIDKIISQKKIKINETNSFDEEFQKNKTLNNKERPLRPINKIEDENISKNENKTEKQNSLELKENDNKLKTEESVAKLINAEMYYSIKEKIKSSQKSFNESKIKKNNKGSIKPLNEIITEEVQNAELNEKGIVTERNPNNLIKQENINEICEEKEERDIIPLLEVVKNYTFKFRRHKALEFLSEYKSLKLCKLMSFNGGDWHKEFMKTFTKSYKMAAINKYIETFSQNTIIHSSFSENNESKINQNMEFHNRIRGNCKTKPQIYNSKIDEKIKMIKANGGAYVNMNCKFKHCFAIFLHINELFIEDLLTKQSQLTLSSNKNHCRITVKCNDFVVDEDSRTWNKIIIQTSSKLGLLKVLDKVDTIFPYYDLWKNGAILD